MNLMMGMKMSPQIEGEIPFSPSVVLPHRVSLDENPTSESPLR